MSEYANTISGLLRKRLELMAQAKDIREQLAVVSNDIDATERVLHALGYQGEFKGMTPRGNRIVYFHRDELRRFLIEELRKADKPISARDLAERIIDLEGKDVRDRQLRNEMVKRVGKSLKLLRAQGLAQSSGKAGQLVWEQAN